MENDKANSRLVDADLRRRIAALYHYIAKRLNITTPPKVVFTQNEENSKKPFGLTGYYDPLKRTIRVYITGRHPTDILRTFSHEMIHHWQNLLGILTPSTGGGQEHYAQKDPVLRQREKEAYLFGNLLFRDFQDEMRFGKINENLEVANPDAVRKAVKQLLFDLVKKKIIRSYHRPRTSGDMDPNDFVDELSRKVELEIDKYFQVVNDRGNWENQPYMIKESLKSKTKIKKYIKKRIAVLFEGINE